jgi:hypothetical protein
MEEIKTNLFIILTKSSFYENKKIAQLIDGMIIEYYDYDKELNDKIERIRNYKSGGTFHDIYDIKYYYGFELIITLGDVNLVIYYDSDDWNIRINESEYQIHDVKQLNYHNVSLDPVVVQLVSFIVNNIPEIMDTVYAF